MSIPSLFHSNSTGISHFLWNVKGKRRAPWTCAMKRLSSFVLPSILSLALTVSPVLAQNPALSRSDDTKAEAETTNAPVSSGQTLDQKNSVNGVPVLSELPPSDTSNPPGRTSR